MALPPDLRDALGEEIALHLDGSGRVLAVNPAGARLLQLSPGDSFPAPLPAARQGELLLPGPRRLAFRAAPHEGGLALVGVLLQNDPPGLAQRLLDRDRGVSILQQELEERSSTVQLLRDQKERLLRDLHHALGTPLNSILGLARLLQSHADGELTAEQEKQVGFIRRSAEGLLVQLADRLGLAQSESGTAALRPTPFTVSELFSALRGTLPPPAEHPQVELTLEEPPPDLPALETDAGKLIQILRHLVANALAFTAQGQVRVRAEATAFGAVSISVADTGVGIAPADQARVFEEFVQLDGAAPRKSKGAGLGLTLSRRLAAVLGGELRLASTPGQGTTFTLVVPATHPDVLEMAHLRRRAQSSDPARAPVLVVEDDRQTQLLYEKYLRGSGYQVIPARSVDEARNVLETMLPAAVVLDVMLEGETSWRFLQELKASPRTRDLPTLVVTITNREDQARALGADDFCLKPIEPQWLLRKLQTLARQGKLERVLVIDDDDVSRYLVKKLLAGEPYRVLEAAGGPEGVRMALSERPDLIILDFVLPEMTAFEVLDLLKREPATRNIPVIISTAQKLDEGERARLTRQTAAVVEKQSLSRELALSRIREALAKAIPS